MNYLFIVSLIILLFSFFKLKKTDQKINAILWIIFSIAFLLAYQVIIVNFLSLINIKSSLLNLGIINFVIAGAILYFGSYKFKKSQRYYFDYKDLISVIVIIICCVTIWNVRYGKELNIVFETTDPAVHYVAAKEFSQTQMVLESGNNNADVYDGFSRMQNAFYINAGLFMNTIPNFTTYQSFIIFDCILLIFSGLLFYATGKLILKDKMFIMPLLISILYVMGYPLSNMLFGFGYLGFSILMINLLLLMINFLFDGHFNEKILIILLMIINLALFFSYYLFVPWIYFSLGLIYLFHCFISKKIVFKKFAIYFGITLIIPFIIGLSYFIIPNFLETSTNGSEMINVIAMEGYIYRSLFSNFVIILPIIFCVIVNECQKKKITLFNIAFIVLILVIFILFLGGMKGKVSSYYYFKFYFPLWLFVWLAVVKSFSYENSTKIVAAATVCLIYGLIFIQYYGLEGEIAKKNVLFNPQNVAGSYIDIYRQNYQYITENKIIFNSDEQKLIGNIEKYKKVCQIDNYIDMNGGYLKYLWAYSISGIVPIYQYEKLGDFYEYNFKYEDFAQNIDRKCMVYFNTDDFSIDESLYETLYENPSGKIIKKK